MKKNKKVIVPFETFVGLCADVRSALNIASFQLKFQVEEHPSVSWAATHVPLLCDYYSCLNALQELLEEDILNEDTIMESLQRVLAEDHQSGIVVPVEELKTVRALMEQAEAMKQTLSMAGLSMEIH